jgi:hypothetical protein
LSRTDDGCGCPWLSAAARLRPGCGPSAAHRELGKHPRPGHGGLLMQLSRCGDGPLLSVNDGCGPMRRARRGHGREDEGRSGVAAMVTSSTGG